MGDGEDPQQQLEPESQGFDPTHKFAVPGARVDMLNVQAHTCMKNVVQRGNYIHCFDGNHGIRLEHNQVLVGLDASGQPITSRNRGKAVDWRIETHDVIPSTRVARNS